MLPSTANQVSFNSKSGINQEFLRNYGLHKNSENWCNSPGHGCSKLTTLLVNISLNFQKLISQICQYSVYLVIKS